MSENDSNALNAKERVSETRHSIAELMDPSGKYQDAYSGENSKWGKYWARTSLLLAALYVIYLLLRPF